MLIQVRLYDFLFNHIQNYKFLNFFLVACTIEPEICKSDFANNHQLAVHVVNCHRLSGILKNPATTKVVFLTPDRRVCHDYYRGDLQKGIFFTTF